MAMYPPRPNRGLFCEINYFVDIIKIYRAVFSLLVQAPNKRWVEIITGSTMKFHHN